MNDIPANDRDTVIAVLRKLPDDASIEAIRLQVEDMLAILESQKDFDEGRVYSHEQVKEEMLQCILKSGGQLVPASS